MERLLRKLNTFIVWTPHSAISFEFFFWYRSVTPNQQSWNLFPLRHQPLVAILSAVGMVGVCSFFSLKKFELGPLIDVDQLSKQNLLYRVDLNSAQWPELVVLPGIGEKLSQSLVDHRAQFGPFRSHEQILTVHGIGESKLASLKPHLLPISNSD